MKGTTKRMNFQPVVKFVWRPRDVARGQICGPNPQNDTLFKGKTKTKNLMATKRKPYYQIAFLIL